jgi:hypothetical protein
MHFATSMHWRSYSMSVQTGQTFGNIAETKHWRGFQGN